MITELPWPFCDTRINVRSAEFALNHDSLIRQVEELRSLGYRHALTLLQADQMRSVVGSDRYVGGLIDMGSGHLHPLNLALGEAAVAQLLGVQVFEHSAVTRIDYGPQVKVHTAQGLVLAKT
ncbi:FAD-binding oxidoreductase, partial [Pseudomonas syringae pv. actinidiae]|nr:FAD-binding oxidoreductase [Pseudomonas syringae pv. actinidiae]